MKTGLSTQKVKSPVPVDMEELKSNHFMDDLKKVATIHIDY